MKIFYKKLTKNFARFIFLTAILSLVSAAPIQALSDFYDSSEIQFYDPTSCDTSSSTDAGNSGIPSTDGETTSPPEAVEQVVWDTLTAGGIDDIHAAAIMGSIANEGGFNPMNTGYVPNNYDGEDPGSAKAISEGYGLIGWTPGTNLTEDMGKLGLKDEKPYTAETQSKVIVGYLQKENKTGRYADSDISAFLGAKTLRKASIAWIGGSGYGFERPADNGPDAQRKRLNSAGDILNKYKNETSSGTVDTSGGESGSPSDACCPTSDSESSGTTATPGSTQQLAQEILDNPNVSYWANAPESARSDWSSSVPAGGNTTAIDTKDVVRALAQGDQAYTTAANAPSKTAELNPNILKFILAVAQGGNAIKVNALTDKTHSDGSNHYKGVAVDIDLGSAPLSVLNPIAAKYGGVKNSESDHHHYDFLDRGDKGPSVGGGDSTPPSSSAEACCPSSVTLQGNDNEQKVYNFLIGKGLSPVQAAGIVGNLDVESGDKIDPFIQEGGQTAPNGGYGIAQWTGTGEPGDPAGARRIDMIKAMQKKGLKVDLTSQTIDDSEDEDVALAAELDYLWQEATSRGDISELKTETTVEGAVNSWLENFEVAGIPNTEDRVAAGRAAMTKYSGGADITAPSGSDTASSTSDMCCPSGESGGSPADDGSPSDWKKMYTGANKAKSDTLARGKIQPKALIIHYTVGDQGGQALLNYFAGNGGATGIQFNVDKDGQVYQYFPLNDMQKTNHVGEANSKSIGIEITGKDANELLGNEKQFSSVVSLAKFLCDKYGIPCSDPKGDITGTGVDGMQGMLGHDETPTNDHIDPDAKAGQTSISRTDSSKHPYMMKLRQTMGFNPTPGKGEDSGGGGSSGGTSGCPDSTTGGGTSEDPVGDGINRALALEAVKYATAEHSQYVYKWGGLHGPTSELEDFVNGGGTDCSGFVRYIIWKVYGVDIGGWTAPDVPTKYFKKVSPDEVEAGDIGTKSSGGGHVDFITDNQGGGKIHEFGAHSTANDIYGDDTTTDEYDLGFYRYIGPKNAGDL